MRYFDDAKIPELDSAIERWGAQRNTNPHYAIIGKVVDTNCKVSIGVISLASNELDAFRIAKIANKFGFTTVETTNYHPNTTFDLLAWEDTCSKSKPEKLAL